MPVHGFAANDGDENIIAGQQILLDNGAGYTSKVTDADYETYQSGYEIYTAEFGVSNLKNLKQARIKIQQDMGYRLWYLGRDGNTIYATSGTTDGTLTTINMNVKDVRSVWLLVARGTKVYEMELYDNIDNVPPAVPTGLSGVAGDNQVSLTWQPNTTDSDFAQYLVYRNGILIASGLTQSAYVVTGLEPDVFYNYHVSAKDRKGNESNKSNGVIVAAMAPEQKPVLTASNITGTSLRLTWDNVAPKYELYNGSQLLTKPETHVKLYDLQGLEPQTQYTFSIIAIDKYGRRVSSDPLVITTLDSVPTKPGITVSDFKHDRAKVTWTKTQYTDDYSLYLDDQLVTRTNDLSYELTGLSPLTLYRVKVVSNGKTSSAEATVSFTTLKKPVPAITGAAIKPVSSSTIPPGGSGGGGSTKRELSYQSTDGVTGVNVYVNGKLIGTYPAGQDKIELDFAELEGVMADIRVEPVDPEGEAYEFQSPVVSAGDASLDIILAEFFQGLGIQRNAYLYLAIIGIPLLILVAIFFFIRPRFKKMVYDGAENKPAGVANAENPQAINAAGKKYAIDRTPDERKKYQKPERDAEYIRRGSPKWQGFTVADVKHRNVAVGFMGMGGIKTVKDVTYERNGVKYKNRYVKGQGRVMVPMDTRNQIKHMSNQLSAFKQVLGSNKKNNFGRK